MNYDIEYIKISLTLITIIVSVVWTIKTIKANHDWNRRMYTANMIGEWNKRTSEIRRQIEKVKPGLLDTTTGKIVEITIQEDQEIYESTYNKKSENNLWELRFYFVELLNHLEYISVVQLHKVGDPEMIEDSFKYVMIQWSKVLYNFIHVFKIKRGSSDLWQPYLDIITLWTPSNRKPRPYTDSFSFRFFACKK